MPQSIYEETESYETSAPGSRQGEDGETGIRVLTLREDVQPQFGPEAALKEEQVRGDARQLG